MRRVAVRFGRVPGWAYLRPLRGEDEESVDAISSEAAIRLLDRLLTDGPGAAVGAGGAATLALPDRDRLLAAVQIGDLTSRIESSVTCSSCGLTFELDADLETVVESVAAATDPGDIEWEAAGVFRTPDGRRFRLPCGEDERAVAALPPEEAEVALIERCMIEGVATEDIGEAMRAVAPLLDLELGAACVDCNTTQTARFDVQHYVLSALIEHGRQRAVEIHQLAVAYRWSLHEILSLPRARRRLHASLIERETAGW